VDVIRLDKYQTKLHVQITMESTFCLHFELYILHFTIQLHLTPCMKVLLFSTS